MTQKIKKYITDIDYKTNTLLQRGGGAPDIIEVFHKSDTHLFSTIPFELSEDEFTAYCERYSGFDTLVTIINNLMQHQMDANESKIDTTFSFMRGDKDVLSESKFDVDCALDTLFDSFEENDISENMALSVSCDFLSDAIDNVAKRLDDNMQGGAAYLYAALEKIAHEKASDAIRSTGGKLSERLSLSDIKEGDLSGAMNYVGAELALTLFKKIYELPESCQIEELPLRAIESVLVNLLHQKYTNPHDILDQFTRNAHLSLSDVQSRYKN